MLANLGPPAAREPGRPLPSFWWLRGVVYAVGFTVSLTAAFATAVGLYTGRRPEGFLVLLLPMAGCLPCGLIAFLGFHLIPGVADVWLDRVVEPRTPYWQVLVVAATCGSLTGAGFSGWALLPDQALKPAGLIALFFFGPFSGIWWLVRRRPASPERDYDDVMIPDRNTAGTAARIELDSLAATEAFGRWLGELLFPNAVVALVGPLGAGKTHLTRAVAEGLGIANPAAVTSPTFTLVHEYPARLPIFHFDAYRLKGPNEFLDLGVNEYYEAGGVCLIEWADKVESALPAERLTIRITPVDESRRRVEVVGVGERYQALARQLAAAE